MMIDRFPIRVVVLSFLIFSGCNDSAPPDVEGGSVYRYAELTDKDFLEKTRKGVFLIDFDANWCGWCRKMDPHLAKLSDKLGDKINIVKIDFDANPEARSYFGVRGIPALFVIVDGKQVRSAMGYQTKDQLFALVKDLVEEQ